ncbi:MAG: VWA domain-containing protein, partial [Anaerolineaceae bacterium]|nr:VWA domain-containing protein [Anaerolineaceae bacterium]
VRQYIEERELTVMLVLDASASCLFGSNGRQKRDLGAELGAVLAYSAIRNNDKVGLAVFSTRTELYVPPRKGRNHILRLIRDLLTFQPSNRGTDIATALQMANRSLKRRSIIFLLSDFLAPVETYSTELSLLAHRHDVIALVLSDLLERKWPEVGLARVEDAETGQGIWIDTNAAHWQQAFSQQALRLQNQIDAAFAKANVDFIHLDTNEDYIPQLTALLQRRVASRR